MEGVRRGGIMAVFCLAAVTEEKLRVVEGRELVEIEVRWGQSRHCAKRTLKIGLTKRSG